MAKTIFLKNEFEFKWFSHVCVWELDFVTGLPSARVDYLSGALKKPGTLAFMEIRYEKTKERYHYSDLMLERAGLKKG